MTPEKLVEEAEAEAANNSNSEKYDQLNTECQYFYALKENKRLKEELQKSHYSFSRIKNSAAHFLFL